MTKLLIRLFVKDRDNPADSRVREAYGRLAGLVGIACNILLGGVKFTLGALTGSIAMQADGVNNLSDVGSNLVTLIGFHMAGKPADKEHPYGHARVEYIAALIISFLILLVGVELGKESVFKIIDPKPVAFTVASMFALVLSILAKLWLGRFTAYIGRHIHSSTMSAATADSMCDVISTGAILLCAILSYLKGWNLDGYVGVLVAGFVLYSGIGILRDTISPLLGEAPSPEMVGELSERLLSYGGICGLHDIMVHNYGPGRVIASAHAEVRADADIVAIHEIIDRAEREVGEKMGILLTIHLDPVETDDTRTGTVRAQVGEIVRAVDSRLRFHDFRMVSGEKQTNLIFDIVVPAGTDAAQAGRYKSSIREGVKGIDPSYVCVIDVDVDYCGVR
ncbi:MAG: cation diffusion facilitator family transporter [Candidatus Pelethousia sp.]|nr:cation diffusion facilitator family transporter [Candidatus Pelethousia sp.]